VPIIFLAIGSFLVGSVSVGYLLGRIYGKDVKAYGSGNIGATNVSRVLGKKAGAVTFAWDLAKGVLVVGLAPLILPQTASAIGPVPVSAISGVCVIYGHCFSAFLHFKGGKGVATSMGVFSLLLPWHLLIALAAFGATLATSRIVSLSSIVAAIALWLLALLDFPTHVDTSVKIAATLCCLLIIVRHGANITRIIWGKEKRFF